MPGVFAASVGGQHPLDDLCEEATMADDDQELCEGDGYPPNRSRQVRFYSPRLPDSRLLAVLLSIGMMVFCAALSLGLGYFSMFVLQPPPVIDKSYRAFNIPNHKASLNYEAFTTAQKHNMSGFRGKRHAAELDDSGEDLAQKRQKRSDPSNFRLLSYQYRATWKMQVVFLATGQDKNIFTQERLEAIHKVEQKIRSHPDYPNFCLRDRDLMITDPSVMAFNGCAPLNSLLTYFYPSTDKSGKILYDGLGSNIDDISSAIKLAMTSDHFYYFVDENVNKTYHNSSLLRTEVLFGTPLKGFSSPYYQRELQHDKFKEFIVTYIDMLAASSTEKVKVLYGSNELFDIQVDRIFWNDMKLAFFTLVLILIIMLILTSFSLWLTICGIISIMFSFPLALFFYRVVFKTQALGILNGAAAFVVIGIGVDDVFVFVNIFRQASHLPSIRKRICYTVLTAGKATFFTSFTTASAFAANVASSIPAVHDFGLFMSLIVSCCWITVMLMMPPALYLWTICFSKCENFIFTICHCKCAVLKSTLPADIAKFVNGKSSEETRYTPVNTTEAGMEAEEREEDEDADVPMLLLEPPMQYTDNLDGDDDDDPLLNLINEHEQALMMEEMGKPKREGCYLGALLQSLIYHYLALPVIKLRWAILVISGVIFVISVGLVTQLHPATKPPQIFRQNTDLQMLLDLKANFSLDDISCFQCSAIYDMKDSHRSSSGAVFLPSPPVSITTKNPPHPTPVTDKHVGSTPGIKKPPIRLSAQDVTISLPQHDVKLNGYAMNDGKGNLKYDWTQLSGPHVRMRTKHQPELYLTDVVTAGLYVFDLTVSDAHGQRATTKVNLNVLPEPLKTTRKPPVTTPSSWHPITHRRGPPYSQGGQQPATPYSDSTVQSLPKGTNVCKGQNCNDLKDRPLLESGAAVYVVFGIKKIDRSNDGVGHVIDDNKGKVVFDEKFSSSSLKDTTIIKKLCTLCKKISAKTELIRNGSAQCLPNLPERTKQLIQAHPECRNLPKPFFVYNHRPTATAFGSLTKDGKNILWLAFAFESTTNKGKSYFESYKQYLQWEDFIQEIKDELDEDSPLQSMFQTSEFWKTVLMEVVAVSSAIYGLVLSLIICTIAVAIFTGHFLLLLVIILSIIQMLSLVVSIFYMAGWEMGGVEAVSLSILVGSSVDYCVHLVEGFLLAGRSLPDNLAQSPAKTRQWRSTAALTHIGFSIISSAITTILAAIPLTQTIIQPFTKFGQIVAINTTVCIVYSLTVCTALLSTIGPSTFTHTWKATVKASIGTGIVTGLLILGLFAMDRSGIIIPGPSGEPLFPH